MSATPSVRAGRKTRRITLTTAVATVAAVSLFGAASAVAAITPASNDDAGAAEIAGTLTAPPTNLTGASYDAVPPSGTPNGTADSSLSSFPTHGTTFGILTTGNVAFADDPNANVPDAPGGLDDTSANLNGPNVRGNTDFDVSVLKVDLDVPASANCLTFDFQFYSEEFAEFVNTAFNDAFIAELDSSTWTTSGSAISAPDNFAFDPSGDVISVNSSGNTSMSTANAAGTTYDGATPLLSASKQASSGTHSLYLSIFDQGDRVLDSAVFLDNLRVGFVPNPAVNCQPGAQPKLFGLTLSPASAQNPTGTPHTVTATLTDENGDPVANEAVDFQVTGANAASGSGSTNSSGEATFTYTGTNPGSDVISACYDADDDGTCEATASATKDWVNNPPDCSTVTASPDTLWPPNHKLRTVTLSGATDPDGDPVTLTITGVTQDEPLNGRGDGNTTPDAKPGAASNEVRLRAERRGKGDGRVYEISFTGDDGQGGTCQGTATVGVPHDQRPGSTAVDSGQTVDSFGP
jgi:Bacterial Ig-like domain (group 1)